MKKHLYFSILIVAVIASVLLSCKKDNNKGECSGAPSISRVSTTLSRTDTSTAGSLADWIIIQGKNLCGTKQVDFNDISVDLKSAFITSNEITLRIPRSLPKEVNNKISITTNTGTAQYDYTVSIPALIVEGLNNEYTVQGGTIALLGKNFDLYGISETSGKVIFGDKEATIVRANSDTLFFKAPNGAAAGDKLKVIDQYGKEYGVPGRYRDPRGILHDFDPYAGWNSDLKISNGPVPSPISGNYANFEGDFVSWVWNTTFHAQRNFTFADLGVSGSLDNYVMRFEINVLKPMNNVPLLIELTQTGGDAFSFTYQQSFFGTTNGWKTISIPMSVFKKDGKTITITEAMAKAVTFNRTFIHTGENISLHFTLDNMRIVLKD